MALYLCVPQVTQKREDMAPFMKNWPMPNTWFTSKYRLKH
jgi:hypothetical protein